MSSYPAAGANPTRRAFNPRQAETVERVAAAALEELRAVGYDGLTVRSVAGRATVAPATAYTYFSSKNHLIAELFWRRLVDRPRVEATMDTPLDRVVAVFDDLATFLAGEPELAAAVTSALLGTEPDVKELRVMIGTEINARIAAALSPSNAAAGKADEDVLDLLTLAWSGAMLQAGMGHARFEQLGARLARAARLILAGSS